MQSSSLPGWYKTLAILSVVVGVGGMCLSFLFMTFGSQADIIAGGAGFIAGAILIGSGLIALAAPHSDSCVDGAASESFEEE